ncbi:hydroxymethylbilane synthase [Inhella proteolytica]|uniref:Porphobilinogen deaminase n=1 Tax=Inhella proteolytica TaxID=2795029 RepID=A0A931NID5_9BURK|nr:hydroxymethylbilane synthase [Inhella proteolytica]MBH9578733.1 hydroxymethylbilane synthase [Inhella proteolytica]
MSEILRIATRKSRLALWQAEHVRDRLQNEWGVQVELVPLSTRGDEILDRSLSKVGGKGLFVKELEVALELGEADLAVHSLKDVPMALPDAFALACVMEREDPRDAFVSPGFAKLDDLPQGAKVGTSSLRRASQLKARRPDLEILPLRGNLDTRLRKLDEGGFDAIVLAAAGLKRLELGERIRSHFALDELIPCAGQGALGIEVRAGDHALRERLASLAHQPTWLACAAEREVSRRLGGSCSMPLAAHAQWQGSALFLNVALGAPEGEQGALLRAQVSGPAADQAAAEALGARAAQALLDQGAQLPA